MRLVAALTLATLLLPGSPICADTLATAENALLTIQVIDTVQTQTWLHGGRYPCSATLPSLFQPNPPKTGSCIAIEADPLARPFVGNMGRNLLASFAVNIAVRGLDRLLFRRSRPQAGKAMLVIDAGYVSGILVPNQRIIEAQR